ncbi:efflux RND transporter periplasmic adaptor subunit [Pseudocolwellia sp. AS88]|uniref:efflux RND transporter periplasmic adaptor subunit n=1 Tax=Pseudocolwellia sp. AS88 TaxID=3063958 RepID=UPI0026F0B765|nr:efflux RND transporter periplasmic adaptor subunit [Pseudocolwellia sp. AS88]MDO7085550.1 efflux RND transporter periplasmic adaptor subunit [Pseudocolwellia sp. AS88]
MRNFFFSKKLLPLFIVILGGVLGYLILEAGEKKPNQFQKKKTKRVRVVQTIELERGSVIPSWEASGFVIAAESVDVSPRVAGNIESINPEAIPGGLLKKGQWLASLETIEYQLALQSQQSQLAQAQANLELELADQVLAQEELKLLGDHVVIEQSLVLREPQLTVAKARVSVAQNNLDKAKLDLDRTKVLMPFDGKIVSKNIGQGSKVSTNTTLFSIVNTNTYWLEVKIPHKFFNILDAEQMAKVSQQRIWGDSVNRQAKVLSFSPELDSNDRQVKILLSIENPLSENSTLPSVFINDFLNVELMGKPINNAWTIKYSWLQADNTIWVVDKNNTLQKRPVKILFKGRELIYIDTDVEDGDRALAEKPGIASVGLKVNTREDLARSIEEEGDKSYQKINQTRMTKAIKNQKGLKHEI